MSGHARRLAVEPEHDGQRLDNFLTALLPDHSRSQVQRLIKDGLVMAGGAACRRASSAVHAGQTYDVTLPEPAPAMTSRGPAQTPAPGCASPCLTASRCAGLRDSKSQAASIAQHYRRCLYGYPVWITGPAWAASSAPVDRVDG